MHILITNNCNSSHILLNKSMATIHMQIKIYTLPYLLTDAKSHSQVLDIMVDSAMTTQWSGIHRTTLGHIQT